MNVGSASGHVNKYRRWPFREQHSLNCKNWFLRITGELPQSKCYVAQSKTYIRDWQKTIKTAYYDSLIVEYIIFP